MDIQVALTKTGYGRFHYKILTVCALSLLSVGLQSNISSFIFQSIQCELKLTSFELGILNVAYLFGGSLSCFLWGVIADNSGRRPTLIIGHLFNVIVTVLSAIFNNVSLLITGRFLSGFLSSAPTSIIFSYLAEFQAHKYRPIALSILSLFFTLAYLILPLLSWWILPIDLHLSGLSSFLLLTPWRLLLVIIAIPELVVGWALVYLPETPIYCLNQGEIQATLTILKLMFIENTGRKEEDFPVKNLIFNRKNQIEIVDSDRWKVTRISYRILQQFKELFQPSLVKFTSLACGVSFASLFGLYGLGLWIPEIFVRFQLYETLHPNNTKVTIKQLTQMKMTTTNECNQSLDNSVIRNTIIVGVVSLICSLISIFIAKRVHLKFIVFLSMLTGSICTFLLYCLNSSLQNLIITSIFQSTMIIGNVQIGSLVTNLFPTDIIGLCLSLVMFSGRLGAIVSNLFFSYFMDDYCEIPIIVVAICLLIGSILCYLIPKNNNNMLNNNNNFIAKSIEISIIKSES